MRHQVTIVMPGTSRGLQDQWRFEYEDAYVRDSTITLTDVRLVGGTYQDGRAVVPPPASEPTGPARTFVLEPGSAVAWHGSCPHII